MDGVEPDARHMTLRAACLELRKYAHQLSIKPRATIRADELYTRLDEALYPKCPEKRREPLDRLIDAARKDEVRDHVLLLEDVLERARKIASDMEHGRGGPSGSHKDLVKRVTALADAIAGFLNVPEPASEPEPPEPATD